MKAAVLSFPGSNCDRDLYFTLAHQGFSAELLDATLPQKLDRFDLITLPGGFSFGDYLRSGAFAARTQILEEVRRIADLGKLVLGICNGFQILCEAKLLPGALLPNTSHRFACKAVPLEVTRNASIWTRAFPRTQVTWPIAHAEGRFYAEEKELRALEGQILFRYQEGNNPNGSALSIAGITNARGNVLGMMPHPERATHLGSGDGKYLWESILGKETQ